MNRLDELYFKWLAKFVCDKTEMVEYRQLFEFLYLYEFGWINDLDENLAIYGIKLRDQFLDESLAGQKAIKNNDFAMEECSVLEVFVSLAIEIEENIMANDHYGDRTSAWFWKILQILDLDDQDNMEFSPEYVDEIVENRVNRGQFCVKNCVKNDSIWIQVNKAVTEIALENGEIW